MRDQNKMVSIKLYTTSIFSTLKTRNDVTRLRSLLKSKGVDFEEIDLSEDPGRGREMVDQSGGVKTLPQLHVDTRVFLDYNEIQEMEDFGELDPVLSGQAQ